VFNFFKAFVNVSLSLDCLEWIRHKIFHCSSSRLTCVGVPEVIYDN